MINYTNSVSQVCQNVLVVNKHGFFSKQKMVDLAKSVLFLKKSINANVLCNKKHEGARREVRIEVSVFAEQLRRPTVRRGNPATLPPSN